MIIRDLNVECVAVFPYETNPELIIDPYAELAFTSDLQCFQAVPRWNAQIVQSSCRIHEKKLSQSHANQTRREFAGLSGQP